MSHASSAQTPVAPPRVRRVRWLLLAVGALLLILLGLRSAKNPFLPSLPDLTPLHVQAVLLVAGIGLLVAGVGGLNRAVFRFTMRWLRRHQREGLLVAGIVLLAFAIRLYRLDSSVLALVDEDPFMGGVVMMRDNPLLPLTGSLHDIASFTRLFSFVQLVLSDLFGSSLMIFRLASVLFGSLTVGATYGLARALFDQRVAVFAAVLLATFPPHIHMSRLGLNNIADPLFGVLALLFFVRALQTRQRVFYALAGAMLGLLAYFYEGGELLFPLLLALWAGWLSITGAIKPTMRGLLWLLLVAVLVALPVHYTFWSHGLPLFNRVSDNDLGLGYWLVLLIAPNGLHHVSAFVRHQMLPSLYHFTHLPDASVYYGGETALILPYLVPLFVLGLLRSLWRPRWMLLVLWVLLTVLGNSLLLNNVWTARFVVVMPGVAILLALGLHTLLGLVMSRVGQWIGWATLLLVAALQIAYYFGPHLSIYNTQIVDLHRRYDLVERVRQLPDDVQIILVVDSEISLDVPLDYLGDNHHVSVVSSSDPEMVTLSGDVAFFTDRPQALTAFAEAGSLDGPYYSDNLPHADQYELYRITR